MKKSKIRFIISLLTVFMMVFAVCPYMGMGSAEANTDNSVSVGAGYTYRFSSLTAELMNTYEGSEYYLPEYYVRLTDGDFDAPDGIYADWIFYRVSGAGMICALSDTSAYIEDYKVSYGATYTYYIADKNHLSAAALRLLPTSEMEIPLTSEISEALTETTASNSVTIPEAPIPGIIGLKNTPGCKTANLQWQSEGTDMTYLTGYMLEIWDSAGNMLDLMYLAAAPYVSKSVAIPYEGESIIRITPYCNYEDKTFWGEAQILYCTSAKIKAPSLNVTKISGSMSKLTVYQNAGAEGVQVQQKVGSKWKNIASKATKNNYKKAWSKNKAGMTSYRARSYVKDTNGKKYYSSWKTSKPKPNQNTYSKVSVEYVRNAYEYGDVFWFPDKISYSGSKIKVTGRFINTWQLVSETGKFKVTFKSDGKVIGTKTISANVKADSAKVTTFYLDKSKKNADLRTVSYTIKTIK